MAVVQLERRISGRSTTGEMNIWPWYNWGDEYLAMVQLGRWICGRGTNLETVLGK